MITKAILSIALSILLPISAQAQQEIQEAICYTVRNSAGKIIEQTTDVPVDMSKHLSQTVPEKYGAGSTMTFSLLDTDYCPEILAATSASPNGFSSRTVSTPNFAAYSGYSTGYTGANSYASASGGGVSGYAGANGGGSGRYAVRGYHRSNGTYVQAHTRGYSSSGGGGRKR